MGEPRRFGDLEVGYDPKHEEREWRVHRAGWAIMALAAVAALAGLLGPGPLSNVRAGKESDVLYVEYQRFGRYQAPADFKIFCRPDGEQFRISLDRGFIEHAEIKEISPEPLEVTLEPDAQNFVFKAAEQGRQLVTIRFESQQFGRSKAAISLDGKETLEIRQFFWP